MGIRDVCLELKFKVTANKEIKKTSDVKDLRHKAGTHTFIYESMPS